MANESQKDARLAPSVASLPRVSRSIPVAIPAGTSSNGQITPGQQQIMAAGSRFYVRACSAPVLIQSQRAGNVGAQNLFGAAQGQTVSEGFEQLNVSNPTTVPIVALIWVGFEDFINDQLVLDTVATPDIVYPTSPLTGTTLIAIPDQSGNKVSINNKNWYLLSRVAVLVGNPDTGATYILQSVNSTNAVVVAPFPGFPIYPQTSVNIPAAGDFCISAGGGPINAYAWEIYNAFAA